MAKQKYSIHDKIFFQCHDCKEIVFKPMGATVHSDKKHGKRITFADIKSYFKEIKNPPQELIEKQQNKKKYKYPKKKSQTNNEGPHFKCNKCGHVVAQKVNLYSHCFTKHNSTLKKIGCTRTSEPTTNPTYKKKHPGPKKLPTTPLPDIMQHSPHLLDITNAEVVEGDIVLTVRIKIPSPYVEGFVIPSIIPSLK